jgi:Icc-related predicted phosphoesterase
VLYIPGNHDSEEMFSSEPPQWETAINMHSQAKKLADGLTIIGFGGSAPIHVIEAG